MSAKGSEQIDNIILQIPVYREWLQIWICRSYEDEARISDLLASIKIYSLKALLAIQESKSNVWLTSDWSSQICEKRQGQPQILRL